MYESIHGNPVVFRQVAKDLLTVKSRWDTSDPYKTPHESWMANLRDPNIVNNIAENLEPAKVFYEGDDVTFTTDELRWMYGFAFSQCLNVRHNANGTIFVSGNLHKVAEKFIDKLEKILPGCSNSPSVAGNFLITPSQYGLHTDSTRETDWINSFEKTPEDSEDRRFVPWRNILIPMWIGNLPETVSHGVFFNQRHIDFAHVYLHGNPYNKPTATTYPVVTDHGDILFHDGNGKPIPKGKNYEIYDKEHWKQYLEYTPHSRLTGLTPELTCEWVPGKPFVFDAFQLHATNKGTDIDYKYKHTPIDEEENDSDTPRIKTVRQTWDVKMGLLLTFLREVK